MTPLALAIAGGAAPEPFRGTQWERAAAAANGLAPYLARLMQRRADLIATPDAAWPERLVDEAITAAAAIAHDPPPLAEGMRALRRAKDATHLACAIADLALAWSLGRVTGILTAFADASVRAALALSARELSARGEVAPLAWDAPTGPVPGFAIIAMGKMGAHELNYSSDVDVSVFFDPAGLAAAGAREPRVAAALAQYQEQDGSWWDYPLYGYHKPYGTSFAIMTLQRCLPKAEKTATGTE